MDTKCTHQVRFADASARGGGLVLNQRAGYSWVSVTTRPVLTEAFPGPAEAGASDNSGKSLVESRRTAFF